MIRSRSVDYIGPFCVFLALLALSKALPFPALPIQAGFVAIMLVAMAVLAWPVLDLHVGNWAGSLLVGVAVFAIWVGPDRLWPGYRHFWLFENPVMGRVESGLSTAAQGQIAVLWLRAFRAVAVVPVVEELFWRGWLMRWLISPKFESVAPGTWSASAFWTVALLFASEHGSYWDVGLAAGVIYNWWMLRTRSLGDLILAHAVTNLCLSVYVVWNGKWEYWL